MSQDLLDDHPVLNRRHKPQPAATVGAISKQPKKPRRLGSLDTQMQIKRALETGPSWPVYVALPPKPKTVMLAVTSERMAAAGGAAGAMMHCLLHDAGHATTNMHAGCNSRRAADSLSR